MSKETLFERQAGERQGGAYLRDAFWEWERLRLVYNCILLCYGLRLLYPMHHLYGQWLALAFGACLFGLLANTFYCLGPLVDFYLDTFLKVRLHQGRRVLFVLGLGLSMLAMMLAGRGLS